MSAVEKMNQELEDILIKVAKVRQIENYAITIDVTPSKTEGFLSELYTGVVKNNDNGETISVAIKKVPKQAGIFEDFADMYQNEEQFYSQLFPNLNKFQQEKGVPEVFDQIPKYILGSLEPGKEHITMENIVAKGYILTNKKEFLDKDYLDIVFKAFGKFHALSFAFKDQNLIEYNKLLVNVTDVFKNKDASDVVYQSIVTNVLAGLNAFDPLQDKDVCVCLKLKKLENAMAILINVNKYRGRYSCIIHGDGWSNNLLFKCEEYGHPDDVKFVDFQMIRESTPVHDLAFFFYTAASEKELPNVNLYLETYYKSFCNFASLLGSNPEKLYPFEALKQEWLEYGLVGLFFGFDLLVLKLIEPEKALEMRNMEEINKEEGLKMWDEEMCRIRKTDEFIKRSRCLILNVIQHGLL